MRDLSFNVKGQKLSKDSACSFNNIVAGSKNYYNAIFNTNSDWDGLTCIAKFESGDVVNYLPIKNRRCVIPESITNKLEYYVSLIGIKGNMKITTNKIRIVQIDNGG